MYTLYSGDNHSPNKPFPIFQGYSNGRLDPEE
jgi:hypothetical protein